MISEKFSVVFDTNSYRNFVQGSSIENIKARIAELKEREEAKNIIALATPVVGLELLANLSGPGKSLHYEDCLKALIAMANHCYVRAEDCIHVAAHPYLHITQNFFDVSPTAVEQIGKNMVGVIMDFKEDYQKAIEGHHFAETFTKLKDYSKGEELRWIREVESYIERTRHEVIKLNPSIKVKHLREKMLEFIDSGLFGPMISMAIIYAIAKSLKIKMTGNEHVTKGYILPQIFPLCVGFYQWICHRTVADNIDLKNNRSRQTRWNWRWDYEVSFLMNDHLINGRLVLLVTSDKDMTRMLKNYGFGGRVMDLEKYFQFLDS